MEPIAPKSTKSLLGNPMTITIVIVFITITLWWLFVHPFNSTVAVDQKNVWSSSYELTCILGGIFGMIAAKGWGGHKSVLGRALIASSIGLFLQAFGQTVYNYYTLVSKIEIPYPSLGDVGYFGSVIAYIYGGLVLLRGMKFPFKSIHKRIIAIVLPLVMLTISYIIFLKGNTSTGFNLTTFLNFGYPFGQAIYVSLALLVMYVSRDYLGGIMKNPIRLLLIALIVQYVCDFNFLYHANQNDWYAGSVGDYMYAVSYFIMTLALINFGNVRLKMRSS